MPKPHNALHILLALTALSVWCMLVHAEEPAQQLDEVIVSAPAADSTLRTIPHSTTVITAEDIAKASSSSLVDLLSRQANVNLQSFFGTDKNATIDLRGMGDTAGSNVLILVDGVRRNEMDLSGADLSTTPLSQIERIEIIRGAGSVMYGNGAVAGIINIITKRGRPGMQTFSAEATYGSYSLEDNRMNASGSAGPFVALLNLSKMDTDGFRRNGGLRSDNASAELRFLPTGALDFLEVYARIATHYDEYGLPGPVSAANFAGNRSQRRSTTSPNDQGTTTEKNYTFGINTDFESAGRFKFQSSLRDRNNDYVLGYSELLSVRDQQSTIDSQSKSARLEYDNTFHWFGMQEKINLGGDMLDGDYTRWENGRYRDGSSLQKIGDVRSRGTFSNLTIQPIPTLTLNGGYRVNRFKTNMTDGQFSNNCLSFGPAPDFTPTDCSPAYNIQGSQGGHWRDYGAEFGITWQASDAWTLFASHTKHFRNPNVDELALAANDLRPQTGKTGEIGARYAPNAELNISTTLFRMRNEDEIFFDSSSGLGVNRNYDLNTLREGLEVEVRWQPLSRLSVLTNMGYTRPRFEGTDIDIPLVPRTTANARVEWEIIPDLLWSVSGRYASSSFDGNDWDNTLYRKVDAYSIYDTALRYKYKKLELAAGINNIFNEIYTTKAYSQTYYPMSDRNGFVRVRLKF